MNLPRDFTPSEGDNLIIPAPPTASLAITDPKPPSGGKHALVVPAEFQ